MSYSWTVQAERTSLQTLSLQNGTSRMSGTRFDTFGPSTFLPVTVHFHTNERQLWLKTVYFRVTIHFQHRPLWLIEIVHFGPYSFQPSYRHANINPNSEKYPQQKSEKNMFLVGILGLLNLDSVDVFILIWNIARPEECQIHLPK